MRLSMREAGLKAGRDDAVDAGRRWVKWQEKGEGRKRRKEGGGDNSRREEVVRADGLERLERVEGREVGKGMRDEVVERAGGRRS